jgi:hypothetical protein
MDGKGCMGRGKEEHRRTKEGTQEMHRRDVRKALKKYWKSRGRAQ